jgi:hypothetical protein
MDIKFNKGAGIKRNDKHHNCKIANKKHCTEPSVRSSQNYGEQNSCHKFAKQKAPFDPQVEKIDDELIVEHNSLDLLVVDSKTGLPMGQPISTITIDRKSRAVCRLHLAF